MDDFGIKFQSLEQVYYLKEALESKYTVILDLIGSLYVGVTFKWNYFNRTVNCSIPSQIPKLLQKLRYQIPATPQYSSNLAPAIIYDTKV